MKLDRIRGLLRPARVGLAALALSWGGAALALGDEIVWVGYQYGGPGTPEDGWWRTEASWFHETNWRGFKLPEWGDPTVIDDGDVAVFDDREDEFIPHVVHFGDYTVSVDPPGVNEPIHVPGGDARVERLEVRDGAYTFDFSPGSGTTQGSLAVDRLIRIGTLDGDSAGDASLTIVGGRLSQTVQENWEGLVVGDGFHATGRLIVQGAGAELDLVRSAAIGNGGGVGYLEARDGGVIRSDAIISGAYYGPTGELSTTHITADGAGSEIIGFASVNNGTLAVTDGARVSSLLGSGERAWSFLGLTDGAHAEALVEGAGSRWDEIGRLTVGGVYHTATSAQGELTIRAGGVVEADVVLVGDAHAKGTVAIDGVGSALRIEYGLAVGIGQGLGSLFVNQGGVLQVGSVNIGTGGGTGSITADNGAELRIGSDGLAIGWDDSWGELALRNGSRMVDAGGLIVGYLGSGVMTIQGGSTAESEYGLIGSDVGRGTATIEDQGSRWDVGASLEVGGSGDGTGSLVVRDGGAATVADLVLTGSGGTIDVQDGGRLLVGLGDVDSVADGTLQVGEGGRLGGTGTIIGDVVVDGGELSPGHSPGLLTIDGDLTLASGVLRMEIGGTSPSLYDQLVVTGDVMLGGLLILDFINGYSADYGLVLDLISAGGAMSGSFRDVQVWNLDPSRVSFDASSGTFSIQIAPAVVPEPSSILLGGVGGLTIVAAMRRRSISG